MNINTHQIISMTEANQNFSKAAKIVEQSGKAIIFKNNKPKYVLINAESYPAFELTDDEKIDVAAKRILNKYRPAFEELAK